MITSNIVLVFNTGDDTQIAILQSDVRAIYKNADGNVFLSTTWESGENAKSFTLAHTFADAILIWTGQEPKETVVVK